MEKAEDILVLRARDFWASLVLGATSVFFLWKTMDIPLWGENKAGVSGTQWYDSAAIVPLFIFVGLLCLSIALFVVSVRSGGALSINLRKSMGRVTVHGCGTRYYPVRKFYTFGIAIALS